MAPVSDRPIEIEFVPTHVTHLVDAAGGPADGSLAGFATRCGRRVLSDLDGDTATWREPPTAGALPCPQCQKGLDYSVALP